MTIQDVQVTIDLQKPTGRLSFGMPLILGKKAGGSAYKEYGDLKAVQADFAESTAEYKMAAALFGQGDRSPARIAIAACDEQEDAAERLRSVMDTGWYYLLSPDNSEATVTALAQELEKEDYRLFVTRVSDKTKLQALKAAGFNRTVAFYHTDASAYPDAALVGSVGSADVGSVTWKFKTCTGIAPLKLTAGELMEIHDSGAIAYVNKQGEARTSEGKTLSGEYIDVIMARDYVRARMEMQIQHLLNQSSKIPYTDAGIAQIESTVINVLLESFRMGIIAADDSGEPLFGTSFLLRNQVDPGDRANREYRGGSFWFEIAGAVHQVKVNGVIRF
ncbi:DUF3383 domain-containing protein [Paenibacillus thiaminolyticus]|uniref:DUF3383 family protein n=1 Tax=Paenibacillus thiaminolyticus TaxID=49283 RepID=UPI001165C4C0|nr:DUF3383 family protein [Paenibacillus thiaminolyticus]NGP58392.1 DUF3383 domain-containing protein [Paenibacillus thiaminolyticus]